MFAKECFFISGSLGVGSGCGGPPELGPQAAFGAQPCSNTSALQTQSQAEFSKQAGLLLHPAIRLNASFKLNEMTWVNQEGRKQMSFFFKIIFKRKIDYLSENYAINTKVQLAWKALRQDPLTDPVYFYQPTAVAKDIFNDTAVAVKNSPTKIIINNKENCLSTWYKLKSS